MLTHNVTVKDRVIGYPHNEHVISRNVRVDAIEATFDDEWSETTSVLAVFTNGKTVIRVDAGYESGKATVTVPWEVLADDGMVYVSFVGYLADDSRIVTERMKRPFIVERGGEVDGGDAAKPSPDVIQTAMAEAAAATKAANTAAGKADDAAASATESALKANSAAVAANDAAESATGATTAANDAAESANDAAESANVAAASAKLATTAANDAAATANASAATADAATAKAETATSAANSAAESAEANATAANSAADAASKATTSATNAAEKAETAAQQATAAANKVFPAADNVLTGIASGAVAHADDAFEGGALRGIAVEGACRQDTTTGKNLFDITKFDASEAAPYGLSISLDGSIICVKGIASGIGGIEAPSFTLGFYRDTSLSGRGLAIKAFDPPSAVKSVYGLRTAEETQLSVTTSLREGDAVDWRLRIAVSDGELAAYEPYSGGKPSPRPEWPQGIQAVESPTLKVAGSDLSSPQSRAFALPAEHPYLAKLPDGTADTIEVNAEGNVELVARVSKATIDASRIVNTWGKGYAIYSWPKDGRYSPNASSNGIAVVCDRLKAETGINIYKGLGIGISVGSTTAHNKSCATTIALGDGADPSSIDGASFYYPLMTPVRYPLAPIDMPKAQDGIINAWTDAEVAPNTSIRYIRDINAVVANIESAIASIG